MSQPLISDELSLDKPTLAYGQTAVSAAPGVVTHVKVFASRHVRRPNRGWMPTLGDPVCSDATALRYFSAYSESACQMEYVAVDIAN